jgi:uncharacterized tellurite resistance protein B-like protein
MISNSRRSTRGDGDCESNERGPGLYVSPFTNPRARPVCLPLQKLFGEYISRNRGFIPLKSGAPNQHWKRCTGYEIAHHLLRGKPEFLSEIILLKHQERELMGIFDKLTGSKNVQLTPKSALVASAITLIAADGVLDEQELYDLQKIVRDDRNAIETAIKVIQGNQLPDIIAMVATALNDNQRMTAMAILLDLAMADGILAGNEQKILQLYMEKFGISEASLKPVIDAIALKNDLSVFSG